MAQYRIGAWDLSELTDAPDNPSFERQIKELQASVKKFARRRKRLDPAMSTRKFTQILSELEQIREKMGIIMGYASLSYSADTQSDEATSLLTRMTRLGSDISNRMIFFDLWWKKQVDDANAERLIDHTRNLAGYLSHKRLLARYSLSEPEEQIINTLDVTGPVALVKLYDKITNSFQYVMKLGGKSRTLTREELTNHTRSTDSRVRQSAYRTLLTKYSQHKGVVGEIYQNIVLNWRDEGIKIRGYDSAISIRNIANDIDDETVRSLLAVCQKNSHVFQKFFVQKAKMLGKKRLRRYDLYAPVTRTDKGKNYPFGSSVKLVLESLDRFSPDLAGMAERVLAEGHLDSEIRRGKRDGAFCSTLSPGITPYVLVNYTGKTRDVFTLAHELGHAVHSQAASKQSILVQDASLPLAETASTFSEMLLYDRLSENLPDEEKKYVLAEKLDDLYATIMRQSYFTLFEVDAHQKIADGATVDGLSDLYASNLKGQFGSSVEVSEDFAIEWSCIPHFYHAPFYCYAYAFGNLLALSLFRRYKKDGRNFARPYTRILAAGGSKKPEEILSDRGIDITKPEFWQDGFDYVSGQVRDLARMG